MATNWCIRITVFTIVLTLTLQKQIDEQCFGTDIQKPGVYQFLYKCPELFAKYKKTLRIPNISFFKKLQPVVCCPTATTTDYQVVTTASTVRKWSKMGKSYDMCEQYSKLLWKRKYFSVIFPGAPSYENQTMCNIEAKPFIVGGTKAKPKEFPHMALIGYGPSDNRVWSCGGSLISDRFVLTAGHCLYNSEIDSEPTCVRLGDLDKRQRLPGLEDEQEFDVIEKHHPSSYESPVHYNDIALLKLARRVVFSEFIRPACLHIHPEVTNSKAIATGWGAVGYADDSSDLLLKVTLNLVSQATCNKTYEHNVDSNLQFGVMYDTQICAGGLNETKDTCQGDSGGPLQIYPSVEKFDCRYWIIGVTSFGKVCHRSPGVYTRVSAFVPWIENIVWN